MESSTSLLLKEVVSHFETWRTTRIRKAKIPPHLWQEAINLYPAYTVTEITKALRLGYSDFKKKLPQTHQYLESTDFIRMDQMPVNIDTLTLPQQTNKNQTTTLEIEKGDGSRIKFQCELNDQALRSIINDYFGNTSCCN